MVLGVTYCLGSELSFRNALVITIDCYCYEPVPREGFSTAKTIVNICRSKNLKLSKFTYRDVSKDQKLTNFKNLNFI